MKLNLRCGKPGGRLVGFLAVLGVTCGLMVGIPASGRGEDGGENAGEAAAGPADPVDEALVMEIALDVGESQPAPAADPAVDPAAEVGEVPDSGPGIAAVAAPVGPGAGPVDAAPPAALPLRCRVKLDVTGELIAPAGRDAPPIRRPITVDARFDFEETAVREAAVPTVSRTYTDAVAALQIGGEEVVTSLANDARRLLVVRQGTTPEPYLEDAFLTAAERDLLSLPFDAVLLDDLLPRAAVAVGEAWEVAADLAAGLLAIDTIESGTIKARLEEVTDGRGRMTLSGSVEGWVDGVPARLTVSGGCAAPAREVDADAADSQAPAWRIEPRVDHVSVVIRERRQAGHVAPGLDVEARLVVARSPAAGTGSGQQRLAVHERAATGKNIQDTTVIQDVTMETRRRGPGRPGRVWHRDAAGRFDLVHDARWRTVEDGSTGLVMRLVDRGALVGQCSVVAGVAGDAPPTIADVRSDIERSLAGQVTGIDEATEEERADGVRIVRVVSSGAAAGLPFTWIQSVLVGTNGGRVDVTCMVQASMRERFADADRDLVGSLMPGDARAGQAAPDAVPTAIREARTPGGPASPPAVPR